MFCKKSTWVLCLVVLIFSGCGKKSWYPPWEEAGQATGSTQSEKLFLEARASIDTAEDYESILASMKKLHRVLAVEPMHREALAYLGNIHILVGTAYTVDRKEKTAHFKQAMKYCELAMYSNPQFRLAVSAGNTPWDAVNTLKEEDVLAMLFWVIALQYEFKEGMTMPSKIINVGWLKHGLTFLDRIKLVAPDFGNGAVEFSYSICYFALPSLFGGDRDLGRLYLEKSIVKGEDYLLPRWGKGTYYHQVSNDYGSSLKDLQWVANQKSENFKDLYPWRLHFITDAKKQLDSLNN